MSSELIQNWEDSLMFKLSTFVATSNAVTSNFLECIYIFSGKIVESAEIYHRLSAVCKSETLVW